MPFKDIKADASDNISKPWLLLQKPMTAAAKAVTLAWIIACVAGTASGQTYTCANPTWAQPNASNNYFITTTKLNTAVCFAEVPGPGNATSRVNVTGFYDLYNPVTCQTSAPRTGKQGVLVNQSFVSNT